MSISCFDDKNHQPTDEEMKEAVGKKRGDWEDLAAFIISHYKVEEITRYFGPKYGWVKQYRKTGSPLASFYPMKDSFSVVIGLGKYHDAQAAEMDLCDPVREIYQNARVYPDGHWMLIPVKNKRIVKDIKALIALRATPVPRKTKAGD